MINRCSLSQAKGFALAVLAAAAIALACVLCAVPCSAYAYDHNADGAIGKVSCPNGNHPREYYVHSPKDAINAVSDMTSTRNNPWRETKVVIDLFKDWNTKADGRIVVPNGCEVTINLHGYMINRDKALSYKDTWYAEGKGEVIYVDGGTLYLYGSSTPEEAEREHKGHMFDDERFWDYDGTGRSVMKGGLITGGACDDWHGAGGISLASNNSRAYIYNTTIVGNLTDQYQSKYGHGAGIAAHGSNCVVELNNTVVDYNHAEGYGGGIYMRDSKSSLTVRGNSEVCHNFSVGGGGGIYLDDAVNLTVEGCKVNDNLTEGYGGGIYTSGASDIKLVKDSTGKNSEVNSNQAWGDGGGIYLNGSSTSFLADGASVCSNRAQQTYEETIGDKYHRKDGGGIYIDGGKSTVTFKNGASINENTACRGRGGGIFVDGDDVTLNIENSSVNSNSALFGQISMDSGGGGIYHNGKNGEVNLKNSSIGGNFAARQGGGIYNTYDGTTFNLDNSTLSSNSTFMSGGGIYLNDVATLNLKNGSKINNNSSGGNTFYASGLSGACGYGAGVYNDDSGTKIVLDGGSSIDNNEAKDVEDRRRLSACGGGVYSTNDMSIVSHDNTGSISNNKSYDQGGGIFFAGEMTIDGITIKGNVAGHRYTGGGVWCDNDSYKSLTLAHKVVIDNNSAVLSGTTYVSNLCIKGKQELCSADGASAISADSKIGVTVDGYSGSGERRVTGNQSALKNVGSDFKSVFYSDDNSYSLINKDGYLYLSGERSDRHTIVWKFPDNEKKETCAKDETVTVESSRFLTNNESNEDCWQWDSTYRSIISGFLNASKNNVIDYWTLTDEAGNKSKVEVKNGVATFKMPDSDVTAEPHIQQALGGAGIRIDETASWNDLESASTTGASVSYLNLRNRFYTIFHWCDGEWEDDHMEYNDNTGSSHWFGDAPLLDAGKLYSFDHVTEGSAAASAVKIERSAATDVANEAGVVTERKVTYKVTLSKGALASAGLHADNASLSRIQIGINGSKLGGVSVQDEAETSAGSKVKESVCTFAANDDGSETLTFQVTYKNKFTVTFDSVGGSMPDGTTATRQLSAGDELGSLPVPTRASHLFEGWYIKGTDTKVSSSNIIDGNVTLEARWSKTDGASGAHMVLYYSENAIIELDLVKAGDLIVKPADPTLDGYIFTGWYSDQACSKAFDFSVAVGEGYDDIELYAGWKDDDCEVDFDTDGGSWQDTDRVWPTPFPASVASALESLGADASSTSQTVTYGSKVEQPANPVREGYVFSRWMLDGEPYDFTAPVTSNIALKAAWARQVTYMSEGEQVGSAKVSDGAHIVQPSDPERSGYRFEGWCSDEACTTLYDFSQTVNSPVTLYAKWTKLATVTFETDGGEQIDSVTVDAGTVLATADLPYATRDNYRFRGWNGPDGKQVVSDLTVDSDITLTARWVGRTVFVWEHDVDSEAPYKLMHYGDELQKSDLDQTIDQAEPVREGYTFVGWYADEDLTTPVTFGQTLTGDTDVYAKWVANKLTLSFDTAGGSQVDSQEVDCGSLAEEPSAPTKDGYVFEGWYTDSELTESFDFSTPVSSSATLYAKWVESVTITFDAGEGVASTESVDIAKGAALGFLPSAVCYDQDGGISAVLAGWFDGSNKVTTNTTFSKDTTLTASWVDSSEACYAAFAIDDEVVDGEAVVSGQPFDEPVIADKDGYELDGWYLDEDCTQRYDFSTAASGNITLYAKWVEAGATSIAKAKVKLSKEKLAYNGKSQKPKVGSVTLDGSKLAAGTDYEVSIKAGKKVGTYSVTVRGTGSYAGIATASYKIVPAKMTGLKAKAAGNGKVKVSWAKHKAQTSGFVVSYAASKAKLAKGKGTSAKVKSAGKTSRVLKGLKSGKKLYVQVRAYKTVGGKTYYSAWSKTKAVKVK